MSDTTRKNPAKRTLRDDENLLLEYGITGKIGAGIVAVFVVWIAVMMLLQSGEGARYAVLKDIHYWLSRIGLAASGVMLAIGGYIGLIRHGDVTPWFRGGTYTMVAFMLIQGAIGGVMYLMGGRAGEEVHIIYGYGVVLSLPFFIFVEVTARRRPAMGSYIWGFFLLAAIIVRCITTGPPVV